MTHSTDRDPAPEKKITTPDLQRLAETVPYITRDGSTIREIIHPTLGHDSLQSLAQATVAPGGTTKKHFHRISEEIYYITSGNGTIELDGIEYPLAPGTAILIPPGTEHQVTNTGRDDLVILCCCAPTYSHDDTELIEVK